MEFEKKRAYLSIPEQKRTGYDSPIDTDTVDLHNMRVSADHEQFELEELAALDPHELTPDERATLPQRLEQARARSDVMREICKAAAVDGLVNGPTR